VGPPELFGCALGVGKLGVDADKRGLPSSATDVEQTSQVLATCAALAFE
jgi:hypothetical protein